MKVQEFFKKGQEVWAITGQGIRQGKYSGLDECFCDNERIVYLTNLVNYKNRYGVENSCDRFPESKVFTTRDAAIEYLRTGKREELKVVAEHESIFNVGDIGYTIEWGGVKSYQFTSVRWRLGQFEYHTYAGGAAVYPERGGWYRTKEEAVEALISM